MKSLWASERRAVSFQDVWGRGLDFGGAKSNSNVTVNADTALGLSAVKRSVSLLADTVSSLPLHAYRSTGDTRSKLPTQPQIVADPSLILSPEEWLQQAMVSLLLYGNGYGVIVTRDRLGIPTSAEWVDPKNVEVNQSSSLAQPTYKIGHTPVDADDVIHLRAFLKPGSVVGAAPLTMMRETFGLGLAAQKFGAQWFGADAHPTGILTTDGAVTEEAAKTIKERFVAAMRGKREPAVLGAGMKYEQIQVSADESQFLETQQAIVADVARAFGIPAEMIGGATSGSSVTYANREQSALDFLTFSINPWLVRIERALSALLPADQFVKFNPDALLRTDTKSRYEAHKIALESEFLTLDEVRELEDRPPADARDDVMTTRELAEALQKIYLSVGTVISQDEARGILNRSGAALPIPGPGTSKENP